LLLHRHRPGRAIRVWRRHAHTRAGARRPAPHRLPLPLTSTAMEPRLLVRGALAGGSGGLLAFVFARILAEPQIQRAVDYESSGHDHGAEVFSRTVQADAGAGLAIVLFGLAMGVLVAVA